VLDLHDTYLIIDDAPEWEVEKIIKACTFGRWKKKQYLVRWKGYSPTHNSWVNSEDMHAEDLISDFEKNTSTVIKAAVACQEATMPFVPYFPPFLSTYAASTRIPGSLDIEDDDNESDQGYSDEDQPMSPEAYDSEGPPTPLGPSTPRPPTPTTEYRPSRLTAYDFYPHGGWGPPSDWPGVPITPLSEVTPNEEPWPYPPERYHSPIPAGALPYSLESSLTPSENPLPPPLHPDTPPSPSHPGTNLLLSPGVPEGKLLLYPQPHAKRPRPRRPMGPITPCTLLSLQPMQDSSPRTLRRPLPPLRPRSEPQQGVEDNEEDFLKYLCSSLRKKQERAKTSEEYARKTPATPRSPLTPSIPSTPSTSKPCLEFDPSRLILPRPQIFPTPYVPTSYPPQYTMPQLVPQLTVQQFLSQLRSQQPAGPIIGQNPPFRIAPLNAMDFPLCH
jgi:hypothetical protein